MLKEKKIGEKDPMVSAQDLEELFLELRGIFGKIVLQGLEPNRWYLAPK